MRKITVYELTAFQNSDPVQYFFPSSEMARVKKRELRAEGYSSIAIVALPIYPTATGIAHVLQNLVDYHCINEH